MNSYLACTDGLGERVCGVEKGVAFYWRRPKYEPTSGYTADYGRFLYECKIIPESFIFATVLYEYFQSNGIKLMLAERKYSLMRRSTEL